MIQHGDRIFGVVFHSRDAVLDQLLGIDIGVGGDDQVFQRGALAGNDQVFQVDGPIKYVSGVHHVNRGDVVVVRGLLDQTGHGLPNREVGGDLNIVGGHDAADLVLVKGPQQGDA